MTEFREVKPARRGFDRLTPLDDVLKKLLAQCSLAQSKTLTLGAALSYVSAETIVVKHAVPGEAIALHDGFAVSALETVGASAYAPAFALVPPQWISCGDRLPQSTDAVLPSHAVQEKTLPIEILAQAAPGDGTRQIGEDFKAGAIIVDAGETIRPIHLALMRSAGIEAVNVRIPRLAILVRQDLPKGDLTGPSFVALANAQGVDAHTIAIDMNDINVFGAKLSSSDADLIVSIGGTGFSDDDHAAVTLQNCGALLHHGIAIHPGETAGCGIITKSAASCPVILAPGRLEAAFAVWLALVRPCLKAMTGAALRHGETLPLSRKISSNPGIADIVLLRHITIDAKSFWEPLASGDLPWQALARAEAWHIVPPESEGYPAGAYLCAKEI